FGQLFRVRGAAHLAQVARAGHQQLLDLAEAAHHQAAIVVEPGAYAQSDVDAFVDNVDPPVAHLQLHAHLRITGEELWQQPRHLLLRGADRHADPDQPARLGTETVHHLARGLCLGQHRLRVAVDALADIGDRETARGALQQADAEFVLELGDAAAEPRLWDAQCAFRRSETRMVDHHREVVEIVEVVHGYPIRRTLRDIRCGLSRNCNNLLWFLSGHEPIRTEKP